MKKTGKNTKSIIGPITVRRKGIGQITDSRTDEVFDINRENLHTALNGDIIEAKVNSHLKSASVIKIVERAKTKFVGTVKKEDGQYFLIPDNRRMYTNIILPDARNVPERHKALVELTNWPISKDSPQGKLLEVLGPEGKHDVEMRSIVLEQGFETTFPKRVEEEANKISENKAKTLKTALENRRDMRNITTFTIDPEDAKDFDDALSIEHLKNGEVEIGVHIADVSYYVVPGSEIDEEAQKRGTSIYLVDRTIPMLPEVLSNDVCSLNEHEDKLTFSAVFTVGKDGSVKSRWFGETVINSNKRFSYEDAQNTLDSKKGKYSKELLTLESVAKIIRKKRFAKGGIDFDQSEVKFKLDKDGKPTQILLKERIETNRLIEDFMLLANREVAEYFYKLCRKIAGRNTVFVYRIHDVPDPDRITELSVFLEALGYELRAHRKDIVNSRQINDLLKEVEGTPEENLVKTATIRSMAKAIYSTKNIGHFGLAFKYYTHFTSPIRRYPDLMVHRILKQHLDGSFVPEQEFSHYKEMAIKSSEREASAVEAERESIKLKQVEYMSSRVGQTFSGTITGVTDWGIFIEEKKTKSEGVARLRDLKDNYYVLDKGNFRLIGQKKKTYTLGDKVNMKLSSTDLESKTIDWKII